MKKLPNALLRSPFEPLPDTCIAEYQKISYRIIDFSDHFIDF